MLPRKPVNKCTMLDMLLNFCCVLLAVAVWPSLVSSCDFPGYLQTNATYRDWRSQVKSQFRDFTVTITVNGNTLRTESTDLNAPPYNRYCLEQVSVDTFLASHQDTNHRSRQYVCLRFLKRSDNVVQMKTSALSNTRVDLCDESNLSLDPWIIVDKAHVLTDTEVCPLVGGYGLILYDREYYTGVCDGYSDNAILESECVEGDGLHFSFRYTRCIPNVLMSKNQRTICTASWVEEPYKFMLIRHDTRPFMWIIRYPSDSRTSFVAYLMKELYASVNSHLSNTEKYVRMNTVQNVARPVSMLCNDESEGCPYWQSPCTSMGNEVALSCPRTCGACNVTRPAVCSFQESWQGDWIDASHGDRVATTFEPSILTVYYSRLQQKFHCIHFDEPYVGSEKFTSYMMVVTDFENGCRLRYSCVKIVHNGTSPVMFLQLSSERNWPFTTAISDPVNCHSFDFDGEESTPSIAPNKYRSKHYKLLYSKVLDSGAMCNIPIQDIQNYSVTFRDDTHCFAGLQTGSSRKTFSLNMSSCSGSVVRSVPLEHHCVDSMRYFSSEQVIVTRTGAEPYGIYCWVFPKRLRDTFYLVEAAHCNENTKKRITKERLKALASFSRHYGSTTESPASSTNPPPMYALPGNNSGEYTVIYDKNSSKESNTTDPGSLNPAAYASPVVVIAAIIFFVIFQVPCTCKNS